MRAVVTVTLEGDPADVGEAVRRIMPTSGTSPARVSARKEVSVSAPPRPRLRSRPRAARREHDAADVALLAAATRPWTAHDARDLISQQDEDARWLLGEVLWNGRQPHEDSALLDGRRAEAMRWWAARRGLRAPIVVSSDGRMRLEATARDAMRAHRSASGDGAGWSLRPESPAFVSGHE